MDTLAYQLADLDRRVRKAERERYERPVQVRASLARHLLDAEAGISAVASARVPTLVSRTRVAELLGVGKNNLHRYEDRIKPFEVAVEGARAPVYRKDDIVSLAAEMNGGV